MNKIPKAVSCLDRALSLNPNLERAWSHKGIALSKLGNYEEALKCYDQAIKINPIISDTWYNKGLNYYNSGNTEDALSCFNKAIEIHNKSADFTKLTNQPLESLLTIFFSLDLASISS